MACIDRGNNTTYLIKLKWYHTLLTDDIAVEVKSFNVAPPIIPINLAVVTAAFNNLAFGA